MTVKNFIKEYNKDSECIAKHIKCTYIPYEQKIAICRKVIDTTYYTVIADGTKIYKPNSVTHKMFYILSLINEYTDIAINFDSALSDFNELEKNNLTELLLSNIPEVETKRFMNIMDMLLEDIMESRSITSFLETKIEAFNLVLNSFFDTLQTVIGDEDAQSELITE